MAPRILIFSIAIGADYSFDIKSGFSIAPAFSLHNNFDKASVRGRGGQKSPILRRHSFLMAPKDIKHEKKVIGTFFNFCHKN